MKNILKYLVLMAVISSTTISNSFSEEATFSQIACTQSNNTLSFKILTGKLENTKVGFNNINDEYNRLNNCIEYILKNQENFDSEKTSTGFTNYISKNIKNKSNLKNAVYVNYLLNQMQMIDQLLLKSTNLPPKNYLSPNQREIIINKLPDITERQLKYNTYVVKKLVDKFGWFTISDFGEIADQNGWLVVQHADQDIEFQRDVLVKLSQLYKNGETSKRNYAYLFDRVAVNDKKLQRYGTQGKCYGNYWEPYPAENPYQIDKLRYDMGLQSINDYKKSFYCNRQY